MRRRRVGIADRPGPGPLRPGSRPQVNEPDRGHRCCSSEQQTSPETPGNRWIQAFALTEVLWLEARQGRPRQALARYIDVIDLWYRGGDWANQWLSLRHVFGILVQLRADLAAATLHGALTAAGSAYALPFEAADAQRISELVDDLRTGSGPAAFASAVRRGTTLSDGEIIDFVRAQIQTLSQP